MRERINTWFAWMEKHPWVLFFCAGFFAWRWFDADGYILAGDLNWPQSFSRFFSYTLSVWDASVNTGYVAARQTASLYPYALWGFILEYLFGSSARVEQFVYTVAFSMSGAGMYLLARAHRLTRLGSFTAGFCYMFGPYAALIAWNPVYGITFPFYAFLPLTLYGVWQFVHIPDIRRGSRFLLLVVVSWVGGSFSNPAFFILFVGILCVWLVMALLTAEKASRVFTRAVVCFSVIMLANSFWLIPFIGGIRDEFQSADNAQIGLVDDSETTRLNSVSLFDALRGIGIWTLLAENAGDYYYDWHAWTKTAGYILFTGVLVCALLITFFAPAHEDKKRRQQIIFLWLFFLVAVAVNSGLRHGGLLQFVPEIIFDIPFFERAFRSVYLKFGILLALPAALLLGEAADILRLRLAQPRKISLVAGYALFFILYGLFVGRPFVTGEIMKSSGAFLPGHRVRIPDSYRALESYDQRFAGDWRYAELPLSTSYNYTLHWQDGGYHGGSFIRFFLSRPVLYVNRTHPLFEALVATVNTDQSLLPRILAFFNIRRVIEHRDASAFDRSFYRTHASVTSTDLQIAFEEPEFVVFRTTTSTWPQVFAATQSVFVSTTDDVLQALREESAARQVFLFADVDPVTAEWLSVTRQAPPPPIIEYRRVSPWRYRVRVHGARGPFLLTFAESYHPGWRLYRGTTWIRTFKRKEWLTEQIRSATMAETADSERASVDDVLSGIRSGVVSDLGSLAQGMYRYISRTEEGTIENENLPSGSMGETWFRQSLADDEVRMFLANGYASGFVVNTASVCHFSRAVWCDRDEMGAYQFELVFEFWPQRLLYTGIAVSIGTVAVLVFYGWFRREKSVL